MSEGTPGRGPDADSRTDTGSGRGATNGRPASQPVRYGPRNGAPRGGANGRGGSNGGGSNGRTVAAPGSGQQYRPPQNGTTPTDAPAEAPAGTGTDGPGTDGPGATPSRPNGRAASSPASYTRPSSHASPARPEPNDGDRRVADARTAAAARNASVARGRGGVAPVAAATPTDVTSTPEVAESADSTAVIPKVTDGPAPGATVTSETADTPATPSAASDGPADGQGGFFGRLRGRLLGDTPQDADAATTTATDDTETVEAGGAKDDHVKADGDAPVGGDPETSTDAVTDARPLTWRDRLGLPPREPKPQPVDVPASGPGVPTAAAAAAVAASVAAGTTPLETKATPTGPTVSPAPVSPFARATPASPVPSTSDTVVIPVVDAGTVSPAAPAAAATAQALVTAKPKVGTARRTRKARLRLSRVDPWSVMKTALLFSIAAGIILVVATYGVWSVLNASGLFEAVNDMVKSVVSTPGDTTPFRIEEYVNTQKIIGVAALIAVVDVLIFTALATLGSFLYNLAATVLGGLEVTLAED